MKNLPLFALALFAFCLSLLPACPGGCGDTPGQVGSKIAHCATQAVTDQSPTLIPAINGCLSKPDFMTCLGGLVRPAVGITEDVVVCLVSAEGDKNAEAASLNPGDNLSGTKAERARSYVKASGWQVAP